MSALAFVLGSLAFAATAQATDVEKVEICHATDSRSNPYRLIEVNGSSIDEVQNKLYNGHGDHTGPVFSASLPKHEKWGDIIPAFGTFPGINTDAVGWIANGCTVPGVYDGEGSYEATHGLICFEDVTYGPFTTGVVTREATSPVSQEAADQAAYDLAVADATTMLNEMLAPYAGYTEGACQSTVVFEQSATAGDTVAYCTVEGTTITITYSGSATVTSPVSNEDALFKAQLLATDRANADLQAQLPTGATPGACPVVTPPQPATVEPEVVAPVQPGTIEQPTKKPAKVVLPATVAGGVVLPSSVPAGDGSSVPTTPLYVLALLALGATALAASAVRLVKVPTR